MNMGKYFDERAGEWKPTVEASHPCNNCEYETPGRRADLRADMDCVFRPYCLDYKLWWEDIDHPRTDTFFCPICGQEAHWQHSLDDDELIRLICTHSPKCTWRGPYVKQKTPKNPMARRGDNGP